MPRSWIAQTMIQPAPVLRSNAPPLSDADGIGQSRVLQEHSGNRQFNEYSYVDESTEEKYPATLLAENAYCSHQAHHQRPHQPHPVHQQPSHSRQHNRNGSARSQIDPNHRARAEKTARYLYHRFRASDQYMKYRTRQQKDEKPGTEQKWPDRLELAFFQGASRRSIGRNMLIPP